MPRRESRVSRFACGIAGLPSLLSRKRLAELSANPQPTPDSGPTGTVGSLPSSTQTQPYCVLLGVGSLRYSSRSCVSLSALIALPLRLHVDAEQLGRVQAQDLVLDRRRSAGDTCTSRSARRHLQPAQPLDLALRAAVPDGIGAPEDVIGPGDLDHLAEHVHARLRPRRPTGMLKVLPSSK